MNPRLGQRRRLLGPRLRAGAVCAGAVLLVAGCTSSTADAPPSSPTASATASPSVIDPSSPVPGTSSAAPSSGAVDSSAPLSSSGISPQEAADRAAVEGQWKEFWAVVLGAVRLPDGQRESALAAVAVDPLKSQILAEVRDSAAEGLDRYGSMIEHPYWEQPIGDRDTAVMGDCQDASQTGVLNVSTGKKETAGVVGNNTRATFERGSDQVWRVKEIYYLTDVPC